MPAASPLTRAFPCQGLTGGGTRQPQTTLRPLPLDGGRQGGGETAARIPPSAPSPARGEGYG
jgi:hypothetical protein